MLPILHQSLWRDEAFSLLVAAKSPLEILGLTLKDTNPPLYFLILHYWIQAFGNSEPVARSLSFLFHILLSIVVWLAAHHLTKSKTVSVLAMLAAFLNPFLLQYAFEIKHYSLFALLTTSSLFLWLTQKKFLSGAFLALAVITHNYGVFTFIAFALFWFPENKLSINKKFFVSYIIFLVCRLLQP